MSVRDGNHTSSRDQTRVGQMLNKLLAEEGLRRELTVSVPITKMQNEVASAEPEPPELPPGVSVQSY